MLQKKVKKYVASGVTLGVGANVLQNLGQGQIAGQVITPAANMLGPMASADIGLDVARSFAKKQRRKL